MKLKSFGCSFVFGTDLHDDGRNGLYATGSKFTFPALVAKHLGVEYLTFARPGASNMEILSCLLAEISRGEPSLYMINWTYIDRFGYTREDLVKRLPRWNPLGWTSIMPIDDTDVARCYYNHIHSELRDKIESLIYMKSAVDALRACNQQFIMTWTDKLLWSKEWHAPPAVQWLQQQNEPYVADFQGHSFVEWSKFNGFEISDTQHPLEAAHEAASDLIITNWSDYLRS